MAYTEADVDRDASAADAMKDGFGEWTTIRRRGTEAVARLRAAALEGAKVPGLEERLKTEEEAHKRTMGELDASEAEVTDLRAQVATLTVERDDERATVEAMAKAIDKHLPGFHPAQSPDEGIHVLAEQRDAARSERDALRAQVERTRGNVELAAERIEAGTQPCRDVLRWLLSTPPAETTPATEREEHKRLDDLGVPAFDRCPATNKRESMSLAERRDWLAARTERKEWSTAEAPVANRDHRMCRSCSHDWMEHHDNAGGPGCDECNCDGYVPME